MDSQDKERKCIGIFRETRRDEWRSVRRNDTHTCGGCGGGCCSYIEERKSEKEQAIGMEKEKVDELLLGYCGTKMKRWE